MTKELDQSQLVAWRTFITAHAVLIDVIDRELVAAGCLPLHWYDVLVELAEAPDHRLRMHQLADQVVLSRSGLTRLVDRLAAEGLLTREQSGKDRRGTYAVLTDKGHAALRAAWPVYAKGIANHFARHLEEVEVRTLADALQRVLDAAPDR
jgi:DNA-binding MarR family transcriptional regulator